MGKKSRDKGYRVEHNLVNELRRYGLDAVRVPLSGAAAGFKGDLILNGKTIEVKGRRKGFKELYKWLENRDVLMVKADFQPYLVVMRLEDYVKLLK